MKRCLALVVSISFIGAALTNPAYGAVKAGAACTKTGSTSVASGKKYTCVKSGKRFIWSESRVQKPIIDDTPLLSPLSVAVKIDVFKARQNEYSWVPSPGVISKKIIDCNLRGKYLYGKVAFTSDLSTANFKVFNSYSSSQSDLGVVFVSEGNANSCGKWQIVDAWGNPDLQLALVADLQTADFVFYTGY
jgi:hypothetical protein